MKKVVLTLLTTIVLFPSLAQNKHPIIPQPQEIIPAPGAFKINKNTKIIVDPGNVELQKCASYISDFLAKNLNVTLPTTASTERSLNAIIFALDAAHIKEKEGYELTISPTEIHIIAHEPIGIFWGIQSLLQLVMLNAPKDSAPSIRIPGAHIHDFPRFAYRGLHLDVSRHMFSVSDIKKYIDLMAFYKLNRFHWHLTDDQGWRIEIKKYPRLHEIGGFRAETLIGHRKDVPVRHDGIPYGGYYTQKEIREIVGHAQSRSIEVIPEIELPGHCLAALAAYPELGCIGGPYAPATGWGIMDDVYCAGSEKVFSFLEDVLSEVMELFPSSFIHIGGDEVKKDRWEKCLRCQARMKSKKLKNEDELQSYFVRRIEKFLNAHGKHIIGWDEILEGKLSARATVMSWRGVEGGIESARKKHNAIMTPCKYLYFDYYQNDPAREPLAIGGYLPLSKVYAYEPIPEELSPHQASFILGVQANLWSEYIKTMKHLEYMLFPRALALAEIAWSNAENKKYPRFAKKVDRHLEYLKKRGVNCAGYTLDGTRSK